MTAEVSATTIPNDARPDLRDALLGGRVTDQELATALGLAVWTVRYRLNLPFVRVGRTRYYDPQQCRERLGLTACGGDAPRGRGRPRKEAA